MAGFDLQPVSQVQTSVQYPQYNITNLLGWFNNALAKFPINLGIDVGYHFPWHTVQQLNYATDLAPQALLNPFLGQFTYTQTAPGAPLSNCDVTPTGPTDKSCINTAILRADHFLYPRKCTLTDLANLDAAKLRQCGLNYEIHPNGWLDQWPNSYWPDINNGMAVTNQYGRTSFLFAGVPGMQLPVSFSKIGPSGLSIYEQVHNSSVFSLYLPIANEADTKMAYNNASPPILAAITRLIFTVRCS
jgi:hypothetical protein